MKMFLVGIVLTCIVLLPRIIPLISPDDTGNQPPSGTASVSGEVPVSVADSKDASSFKQVPDTDGSSAKDSADGSGKGDQNSAASAELHTLNDEMNSLKSRLKKAEDTLTAMQNNYKEFSDSVNLKFRNIIVENQMAGYRAALGAGSLKVPEWAVPLCHKASLDGNDLQGFYKLGCGMVRAADDEDPPQLAELIRDLFVYHLNDMKLVSIRLYRESLDHAGKLVDIVPPGERAENAPDGLPVSSVNLNGTIQCKYSVDSDGKLKLMGALYSIPRGELIHKSVKSGSDYQDVVKELAKEFAGLSEKLASKVASN